MSRPRQVELAERRAQLIARSEEQRRMLSFYCRQFEGPVRLGESAFGFAKTLGRSPLFITALAAGLMKTPWRRLARWPKLAWKAWKIFRFVRGWTS